MANMEQTRPNGVGNHDTAASAGQSPIAICGMAVRLPGQIHTPLQLWDFLLAKNDARARVPKSRYNVSAFHSNSNLPGTVTTEYGYFLDESVDIAALDTSRFSLSRTELEASDPQQRLLLEVVRECLDDAGEVNFSGRAIGCYVATFGEDWLELNLKDPQQSGLTRVDGCADFMLSNRLSYEMNIQGPSMTIKTGCSSAIVALDEAVMALSRGTCESAIIAGSNLILSPAMTANMFEKGLLSPEGSCKTFSADADGYARAEGINAIFIKPLDAAIRDGNPIRAVIRSVVSNNDGKTPGLMYPSASAQELLIRKAYQLAGITDLSETAYVECHGTGTAIGDPIEVKAISEVFGNTGVYIGSVKPNVGHSEGASGLTSLIKCVLALEHRMIPPNIKFSTPSPKIPFKEKKLSVPTDATAWPESCSERISVNSFGAGGSNAHVVLDSPRNWGIPVPSDTQTPIARESESLLILSAGSGQSLQRMTNDLQNYLQKPCHALEDIAYTLANRRERMDHRSFIVTTQCESPFVSQGQKIPNKIPSLVMVFTGQGGQWAGMGRELLLQNDSVFQKTIRLLDKHITVLDKNRSWTLEDELLKATDSSQINLAEKSQPLCTAVQIALVDSLAAIGISPDAVVGHSSGEIAAAYAAGALSAKEAIAAAWQRGLATVAQKRPGAMAAVTLGREDVVQFISPPKVVIACENSPKSVTLSGDTADVEMVLERVKQVYPNASTRILKVDKAYHSYHMEEVGEAYERSLDKSLSGKPATKPFFSSVTGQLEQERLLDAKYWRQNLESPVLFSGAVLRILESIENVAFLEIGPHSALRGPLRQIFSHKFPNKSVNYVATLERGENGRKSFLTTIGRLFELGITIDFGKVFCNGSTLPDLPRYPWNHDVKLWKESRISQGWRQRKHSSHPILGVRQLESSDLEPSWRILLDMKHVPWLHDHRLEDEVVFPGAGYIAMAGEAIRQVDERCQDGFQLRRMVIKTAMVLKDDTATEIITTLRPLRLIDYQDTEWWVFTVVSYNGHTWNMHCTGEVSFITQHLEPDNLSTSIALPRKIESAKLYKLMERAGLNLGPSFTKLEDIQGGALQRQAKATTKHVWEEHDKAYFLHPMVIDACMQLGFSAGLLGKQAIDSGEYLRVPTKLDSMVIRRPQSIVSEAGLSLDLQLSTSAEYDQRNGDIICQRQQAVAKGVVLIHAQGLVMSRLPTVAKDEYNDNVARITWKPHIDFLDVGSLIKPTFPHQLYTERLDEITRLCVSYSHYKLRSLVAHLPHLNLYREWLENYVGKIKIEAYYSSLLHPILQDEKVLHLIGGLVNNLDSTPVFDVARGVQRIAQNVLQIFKGEIEPMEILLPDDLLYRCYTVTDSCDRSEFIQHLAHTRPNLRILEIGAGTGATSASILKILAGLATNGRPRYSKYTYTDISSGFFPAARQRLKDHVNVEYRVLDISKDPSEQGFAGETYDLILATNVIHATKSLRESLTNIRRLLNQNGRLLLHELCPETKWGNFIFGTVPGWWYGAEDGRIEEPYVSPSRWEAELRSSGFDGLDAVVLDAPEPHHLNAIMVARPSAAVVDTRNEKGVIYLLCQADSGRSTIDFESYLEGRGYASRRITLEDEFPASETVISLLDWDEPFFEHLDSSRFEAFKRLVSNLKKSGLLWITRLSQVGCRDPRWSQVAGAARALRMESLVDFAVCEVDELGSSSMEKVMMVYEAFQNRRTDTAFTADYDYAIVNNTVLVGRIFPYSPKDEWSLAAGSSDSLALTISNPGRLDTMRWTVSHDNAPLNANEVEVETYVAGLNYKDISAASGTIPCPTRGFGEELSGIVRNVGSDIKTLHSGDRVMVLGGGSLATMNIVPENLCVKIPEKLTFEEAATLPTAFCTAMYCLLNLGKLQAGQSILIHSAAGGVGIAAIQLAQMIGAKIYATVGNEQKKEYLVNQFGLFGSHIFSSKDVSFEHDIMRETQGLGVDLALNSLSGECIHATWRCIAEFGTMVDIGTHDMLSAGKLDMNTFLGSRTYTCFDLDQLTRKRPNICKELLQEIVRLVREGSIMPVQPRTVFHAAQVKDAFIQMQQGLHAGKFVISIRNEHGEVDIDASTVKQSPKEIRLSPSSFYLLVGGLGGLGRSVSRRLVELGARNLIFLSRSATLSADNRVFVAELESTGCSVKLYKGSVVDAATVSKIGQENKDIKGIFQCSMVLQNQRFDKMNLDEWNAVTEPRIKGTWNLHNAVVDAGIKLDFFVLFSSLAGVIGTPGQANYASTNTFLDAFVQYRNGLGLAASVMDLGAVEDVGYAAQDEALMNRLKSTTTFISESDFLEAVVASLAPKANSDCLEGKQRTDGYTHMNTVMVGLSTKLPLSNPESRSIWRRDPRMAVYHNSVQDETVLDNAEAEDRIKTLLAQARSEPEILGKPETAILLAEEIRNKLCELLLQPADTVDTSQSLSQLGMDSLIGVEIRAWIRQMLRIDITVLEMMSFGSLNHLGEHVAEGIAERMQKA